MNRILAVALPILILVFLGIGGYLTLDALAPEPEKADEAPPGLSVFAEAVTQRDLKLRVEAQGEVRPKREIVLAPQIAGRISYVSPDFIAGGFIRSGQVLVRLEAADYELGVVRARSGVASAEQRLARERAEADIARQDLEELGITDASPLAMRAPQLAEAQAALDSARAQLADAELALSRTAIVAPFSGRVRERSADLGQYVPPGQMLGTIFDTDVVEVALPMDDAEMGRLGLPFAFAATAEQPGPSVLFSANVGGERRQWIGEVKRTAASVNAQTRLINVIAELDDPFGEGADNGVPMAPGLFVDAEVEGSLIEDVFVAPRAALRGVDTIYIGDPEAGTLAIRNVDVVFTDQEGAYIASGVAEGELAVVSPIQAAFEGMSIKVIERRPNGELITHEPIRDGGNAESESNLADASSSEDEGVIQ